MVLEICTNKPLAVKMIDAKNTIDLEMLKQISFVEANSPRFVKKAFEELRERLTRPVPSIEKPLVLELKNLLSHLKSAYLRGNSALLVIVSIALTYNEEEKLLRILREYKTTLDG